MFGGVKPFFTKFPLFSLLLPISVMGVSQILFSPNLSSKPKIENSHIEQGVQKSKFSPYLLLLCRHPDTEQLPHL